MRSPYQHNATLHDPTKVVSAWPNRSYTSGGGGEPGTRIVRRTITNRSTVAVTAGLMRITSLSQLGGAPKPGAIVQPTNPAQTPIINPATPTSAVAVADGTVTVQNLALAAPAADPPGGGLGTTLAISFPNGELAPGDPVHIAVTFAVDTTGTYWLGYNVDAIDLETVRQQLSATPSRYAGAGADRDDGRASPRDGRSPGRCRVRHRLDAGVEAGVPGRWDRRIAACLPRAPTAVTWS
jgi:hypothetical protein